VDIGGPDNVGLEIDNSDWTLADGCSALSVRTKKHACSHHILPTFYPFQLANCIG